MTSFPSLLASSMGLAGHGKWYPGGLGGLWRLLSLLVFGPNLPFACAVGFDSQWVESRRSFSLLVCIEYEHRLRLEREREH